MSYNFKKLAQALVLFFLITITNQVFANLRLPALIGNNMVLQQSEDILIWGWDDPGAKIYLTTSWSRELFETTSSESGVWQISVRTPKAGGPYTMKIEDKSYSILLQNIMIGEVWLCSGQSNMEFQMQSLGVWEAWKTMTKNDPDKTTHPYLRLFTVQRDTAETAQDDCKGYWQIADSTAVDNFSATAYFFGKYLSEFLKVPIGLISSAWGGTPAETWIPIERIKSNPDLEKFLKAPNKAQWWSGFPGKTYNGMIKPLTNYKIKGAIWYQGESNVNNYLLYPTLMENLISAWRTDWKNPEMPFYFVQIAPFDYENPATGALLREAQQKCLEIPSTGMVVSLDLVDNLNDIHPKNKWDIGKRLSQQALVKTYNINDLVCEGPIFSSFIVEGNKVRIHFSNAAKGLIIKKSNKSGFLISGNDRRFYEAEVKISSGDILVFSSKVKNPVAVRYAFENTSTGSLFNLEGFPASTFRTDNWDIITSKAKLEPLFNQQSGKLTYQLSSQARESDIYYEAGKTPDIKSKLYITPIEIEKSTKLFAVVSRQGYFSQETNSWNLVKHQAQDATIKYLKPYSWQYPASGERALVDGILGSLKYNDNCWQGIDGNDIAVEIDLERVKSITTIKCNFLKDYTSWIFLPIKVKAEVSVDGKNYREVGLVNLVNDKMASSPEVKNVIFNVNNKIRYVRFSATNQATCPEWHDGSGEKAWLFLDEISVE